MPNQPHAPVVLASVAGRYAVQERLGRGGMGLVYRVRDSVRAEDVALKLLVVPTDARIAAEIHARFEREFHTLSELAHPRIIQVFEYGLDAAGPFYTMELLDGGDLLGRSPLPWRDACELVHDVCSSLALLHSRRFVHCDVSPRNVRCTRDGRAKLIDFGAMVPMGRTVFTAGTPSFTAPEVVARGYLDGRCDLFSLGATLYYALTGRVAFAARDFSELATAFGVTPRPPSHFVAGVPEALDRLVLSLLALHPEERPRSAFEVMQRLAAIAGIEHRESADVSTAYLSTPRLVGRELLLGTIDRELELAVAGHGRALRIVGAPGFGRSRVLTAAATQAQLHGACVLIAGADAGAREEFAVARALTEQLRSKLPHAAASSARAAGVQSRLLQNTDSATDAADESELALDGPRAEVQEALLCWWLAASNEHPIVIAVDDIDRIDESSLALIAQCAGRCEGRRIAIMATSATSASPTHANALAVMERCARNFEITPLSEVQTISLLDSLFGDVPNLAVVGRGIHDVAGGNPHLTMELARHLVETRSVRYEHGSWTLPSRLGAGELPASAESALQARVHALSPIARWLVEAQALASHEAFTREHYCALAPDIPTARIDYAVRELIACELVTNSGPVYSLVHRSWLSTLVVHLDETAKRERHAALARLYGDSLLCAFHCFAAGELDHGFTLLVDQVRAAGGDIQAFSGLHITAWEFSRLCDRALEAAATLRRSPREIFDIQRWALTLAVGSEDFYYWRIAPVWLERLRADSGLSDWQALADVTDPKARITQAMRTAFARYAATPEAEQVCRPDEAIRHLVHYVVVSIAIGSRSLDGALIDSLPALLEPFAPLSPAVAAIHQNALATREAHCLGQAERARERWLAVYETLRNLTVTEIPFVDRIRRAIANGIAAREGLLGLPDVERWVALVEEDPVQVVQAMYLRKVVCLQQGDWAGAERFRKSAEQLSLQSRARPMFSSTLIVELLAHTNAADLTGVRQVKDRIDELTAKSSHWRPAQMLAEAIYQRLRGDLEHARREFEACASATEPVAGDPSRLPQLWALAAAGQVEVLTELNRPEAAESLGANALLRCEALGLRAAAHDLVRALALAEARSGKFERAVERLDRLIDSQVQFGTTGLLLGANYEARARVAIWAGDEDAVTEYARLTAEQYRRGVGSPLGARYERLMDEARAAFPRRLAEFAAFDLASVARTRDGRATSAEALVTQVLRQANSSAERALFGLSLLLEDRDARGGHLYLAVGSGLQLMASVFLAPAPAALTHVAEQYLFERAGEIDAVTQFEAEHQAPAPDAIGKLTLAGVDYDAVVLSCALQGEPRYVGLALLVRGPVVSRRAVDARLSSVLAAYFVEAGDSQGIVSRV